MSHKQVILVRRDLNMSPGKVASQVAHASLAAILNYSVNLPELDMTKYICIKLNDRNEPWLKRSFTKVVLGVDSEKELLELYEKAKKLKLYCSLIEDEGRTELEGYNYTTVGIGPDYNYSIDFVTGHLKRY